MSSYNVKCIAAYIFYAIFTYLSGGSNWVNNDTEDGLISYLLIPLAAYLILPLVLKKVGHWKIVAWVDKAIDSWYHIIKEKW